VTDEAEMWKKTAVRRLIKLLPLSPTRAKDLYAAEQAERQHEEAIEAEFSTDAPKGIAGAKEHARKALEASSGTVVDGQDMINAKRTKAEAEMNEPDAAERAAILEQEKRLAGPGTDS
jgi:hypothetical protein